MEHCMYSTDDLYNILCGIYDLVAIGVNARHPIDQSPQISATMPYIVDYKERKHLFLFSTVSLTLTVEDIGTMTIAPNTFTNISFPQGYRLLASNISSTAPIYVYVKATDEIIP